jgi:hypothetical protein
MTVALVVAVKSSKNVADKLDISQYSDTLLLKVKGGYRWDDKDTVKLVMVTQ